MTELKAPKLNPKKHSGYIICRRLNKVMYIYKEAWTEGSCGFICDCGRCTKLDPFYHDTFYKGVML